MLPEERRVAEGSSQTNWIYLPCCRCGQADPSAPIPPLVLCCLSPCAGNITHLLLVNPPRRFKLNPNQTKQSKPSPKKQNPSNLPPHYQEEEKEKVIFCHFSSTTSSLFFRGTSVLGKGCWGCARGGERKGAGGVGESG